MRTLRKVLAVALLLALCGCSAWRPDPRAPGNVQIALASGQTTATVVAAIPWGFWTEPRVEAKLDRAGNVSASVNVRTSFYAKAVAAIVGWLGLSKLGAVPTLATGVAP